MGFLQNFNIRRIGRRFSDGLVSWTLAPLTFATAISGAFLTYDWAEKAKQSPDAAAIYRLADEWIGTVFFLAAFSAFIVSVIDRFRRPSVKKLERKVELIGDNFRTLCDGLLTDLCAKLQVSAGDDDRVSLYVHDGDAHFVLCGRFSPNPLRNRPGRPQYPDNQGCILHGWQNGWHFENDLGNGNQYRSRTQNKYGINIPTLDLIKMQSKLFAAQRIDFQSKSVGLVVVESMRRDRFNEAGIQPTLQQFCGDYGELIARFREYIPIPSTAKKSGF
jgi:hypothetical protein